ncbi:hypothetical protein [Paracoccus sp. (in: a-proteobacteria)]|uniref:glycoside hydrolase family 16 protein n=1 Tax=Paracoccus sp. TaxID=267 RepID=UPI00396C6FC8
MDRRHVLLLSLAGSLSGSAALLRALSGPAAAATGPSSEAPEPIWNVLSSSRLSIPSKIDVPSGQNVIHIPVSADHTERESFYAYVSGVANARMATINVGGAESQARYDLGGIHRWSPGDDLSHYLRVQLPETAYRDGQRLKVVIRVHGLGSKQKGRSVLCTFRDGARFPDMPPQFHRPLRRLDLSNAVRKNSFDPATLKHSETGYDKEGRPCWRSRLTHGHSQTGNGETGAYLNEDVFPRANKPITHDPDEGALRLHTFAFPDDEPLIYKDQEFKQQAAVIQGHRLDDVCGTEGVWRMVAKTSRRRYAWPAFWLIGRGNGGRRNAYGMWPPEIDIMEQFNQTWGNDVPISGYTTNWAQHYGNAGSGERVSSFGSEVEVDHYFGTTTGVHEDYHSYACAIVWNEEDTTKSEVVFFFDDVELGTQRLFARHEDMKTRIEMFPIANVAVRTPKRYSAERYNTDDGRGFSGDMLIRDIGYYPRGFAFR